MELPAKGRAEGTVEVSRRGCRDLPGGGYLHIAPREGLSTT